MGHYLGEMYPRGMEVEQREHYQREVERRKKQSERFWERRGVAERLMAISGEELPQDELRDRITVLFERYRAVTSSIPVPVTLHLKDGEDNWRMTGSFTESALGVLWWERNYPYSEDERYEFGISEKGARATHIERLQVDLLFSQNSEREIRPGEELFDRLIRPLEQRMGLVEE